MQNVCGQFVCSHITSHLETCESLTPGSEHKLASVKHIMSLCIIKNKCLVHTRIRTFTVSLHCVVLKKHNLHSGLCRCMNMLNESLELSFFKG